MEHRPLGNTGLSVPILSFGASSLGQEFRPVDVHEALRAVHVALDCGMNFIDTSPYYGRGMSEVLLGVALRDVPRDRYLLCTKLGRYAPPSTFVTCESTRVCVSHAYTFWMPVRSLSKNR